MDNNDNDFAEVDYEIILHLGTFFSIDLLRRGVYSIRVQCSVAEDDGDVIGQGGDGGGGTGDQFNFNETNSGNSGSSGNAIAARQYILPVGCFSAPSSLDINVRSMTLEGPPMLYNSYIEESDKSFRTRTCIVRYREETHELNDGIHYRFTVPKADLSTLNQASYAPSINQTIVLTFDLLCCEFLSSPNGSEKLDLVGNLSAAIPENRIFNCIASQSLGINRATSGIHEYYPINFSRDNFARLDVMVHSAVTSIRFARISMPSLLIRADDSFDVDNSDDSGEDSDEERNVEILNDDYGAFGDNVIEHEVRPNDTITGISLRYNVPVSTIKKFNNLFSINNIQALKVVRIPVSGGSMNSELHIGDGNSIGNTTLSSVSVPGEETTKEAEGGQNVRNPGITSPSRLKDVSPNRKAFTSPSRLPPSFPDMLEPSENLKDIANSTPSPPPTPPPHHQHHQRHRRASAILSSADANSNDSSFRAILANLLPKTMTILSKNKGSSICISLGPPIDAVVKSPISLYNLNCDNPSEASNDSNLNLQAADANFGTIDTTSSNFQIRCFTYRKIIRDSINKAVIKAFKSYTSLVVTVAKRSIEGIDRLMSVCNDRNNGSSGISGSQMKRFKLLDEWIENSDLAMENLLINLLLSCNEDDIPAGFHSSMSSRETNGESVSISSLIMSSSWSLTSSDGSKNSSSILANTSYSNNNDSSKDHNDGNDNLDTKIKEIYDTLKGITGEMMSLAVSTLVETLANNIASYWADLYLTIRRNLKSVTMNLKEKYWIRHKLFWKKQLIIETCAGKCSGFIDDAESIGGSGGGVIKALNDSIKSEFEAAINLTLNSGEDTGDPSKKSFRQVLLARGLPLFDVSMHSSYHKLPTVHIQQYSRKADFTNAEIVRGGSISLISLESCETGVSAFDAKVAGTLGRKEVALMKSKYNHLVVMVSGYRGNSRDLRTLKDVIISEIPYVQVLCSNANDENSLGNESIKNMASRLTKELLEFCRVYFPELLKPASANSSVEEKNAFKISFIGHSMGGLIIRKALEDESLKILESRYCFYLSLSTPHLGSLYAESALISTSMWAILKWTKNTALKELILEDCDESKSVSSSVGNSFKGGLTSLLQTFRSSSSSSSSSSLATTATAADHPLRSTLIYQMSQKNTLSKFQKVIVATTNKDAYVPQYSAVIRPLSNSSSSTTEKVVINGTNSDVSTKKEDEETRAIIHEMGNALLSPIDPGKLLRIYIDNAVSKTSVDSMIGRAAHISYLENVAVARSVFYLVAPLLSFDNTHF